MEYNALTLVSVGTSPVHYKCVRTINPRAAAGWINRKLRLLAESFLYRWYSAAKLPSLILAGLAPLPNDCKLAA